MDRAGRPRGRLRVGQRPLTPTIAAPCPPTCREDRYRARCRTRGREPGIRAALGPRDACRDDGKVAPPHSPAPVRLWPFGARSPAVSMNDPDTALRAEPSGTSPASFRMANLELG